MTVNGRLPRQERLFMVAKGIPHSDQYIAVSSISTPFL